MALSKFLVLVSLGFASKRSVTPRRNLISALKPRFFASASAFSRAIISLGNTTAVCTIGFSERGRPIFFFFINILPFGSRYVRSFGAILLTVKILFLILLVNEIYRSVA